MSAKNKTKKYKNKDGQRILTLGMILITSALLLLLFQFFPILKAELSYNLIQVSSYQKGLFGPSKAPSEPRYPEFGIMIPKLGINSKVIPNVDPYNSRVYQQALAKGVAHAKGTALPGQNGNIVIFAHSSVNFWDASKYNSIFYLLSKLETNDEINIYYKQKKYSYVVFDKKIVAGTDISYLEQKSIAKTITLMTCWPPGTNIERMVVIGNIVENN